MNELEDKLNALLSDPDGMAQVMELAQKLSGKHDGDEASAPNRTESERGDDLSSLLGALGGGLDGDTLRRLLPVVQQATRRESGEAAALLYALRPFLREERRDKVERAVQLARMLSLGKTFLNAKEEPRDV